MLLQLLKKLSVLSRHPYGTLDFSTTTSGVLQPALEVIRQEFIFVVEKNKNIFIYKVP